MLYAGFSYELFGITFGIIDIAFIVILLIMFFVGIGKGFINYILSSFKGIISLLAAIFLCKPGAKLMEGALRSPIYEKLLVWVNGMGSLFTSDLPGGEANRAVIEEGLKDFHIPNFLSKYIVDALANTEAQTLGIAISDLITTAILITLAFLVILILVRIILLILRRIFKDIGKKNVVGAFDRILGGIFSLALGVVIISAITMGIAVLVNSNFLKSVSEWIVSDMHLGEESVKGFAKWIYNNNPIGYLLELL